MMHRAGYDRYPAWCSIRCRHVDLLPECASAEEGKPYYGTCHTHIFSFPVPTFALTNQKLGLVLSMETPGRGGTSHHDPFCFPMCLQNSIVVVVAYIIIFLIIIPTIVGCYSLWLTTT